MKNQCKKPIASMGACMAMGIGLGAALGQVAMGAVFGVMLSVIINGNRCALKNLNKSKPKD